VYPVSFSAEVPLEGRNRLSTFFRYIFAIPALIVSFFFAIGGMFATLFAWFAIVFTGRYPQGLYDFNVKVLRISTRTNAYISLANDEMPPLNGDEDPGYPVQIGVAPPLDKYSRLKTFFRGIVGIPVMILAWVWGVILSVVTLIAWLAILFTGKMPEGLVNPLEGALAYNTKAGAYFYLLTEDWPPFSNDEGSAPAGEISQSETKTPV
jgi:ABC-type sugar transport system permease subunit